MQIKINGIQWQPPIPINGYISYSDRYQRAGGGFHQTLLEIKGYINTKLKDSSGTLYCCYDHDKNKREPDIDNVLLYNLHVKTTNFNRVVLQRKRTSTNHDYTYDTSNVLNLPNGKQIACVTNVNLSKCSYPYKSLELLKPIRDIVEKTIIGNQTNIAKTSKTPRLMLEIKHGGKDLSESDLIKPLVDAIIGSLHKFNQQGLPQSVANMANDKTIGLFDCPVAHKHGDGIQLSPRDDLLDIIDIEKCGNDNALSFTLYEL